MNTTINNPIAIYATSAFGGYAIYALDSDYVTYSVSHNSDEPIALIEARIWYQSDDDNECDIVGFYDNGNFIELSNFIRVN